MELYSFYFAFMRTGILFFEDLTRLPIYSILGSVLLLGISFLFYATGLYTMAKNLGDKRKMLAFVPFVNLWYVGKLVGESAFFNHRTKRLGMYAMIAQIVATSLTLMTMASECYLWLQHGVPQIDIELYTMYWPGLTGFSSIVFKFYDLSAYLLFIAQLICCAFMITLFIGLFKKYAPRNYSSFTMLMIFVPVSRFFIVFALRKRKAVDFEAFMRARQAAYARRQQEYYNQRRNPYNSPYGGYNDGYQTGQNPYERSHAPHKDQEEPFAEFSKRQTNPVYHDEATDGFFD